ncbi:MAG: thiol-disulfide oxidoreductase DCC family protein [Bacteroidales bacterium]
MFTKLYKTDYPPKSKPLMAWDGNCGFCHYWVLRWKKFSGDAVEYQPYAKVAHLFPDIELRYFKQAVRLIDTDGRIYTGPAAAFQSFRYGKKYRWLMPLYSNFKPAEFVADQIYRLISKNRPFMYRVSVAFWGRNPVKQKPYWLIYFTGLALLVTGAALVF